MEQEKITWEELKGVQQVRSATGKEHSVKSYLGALGMTDNQGTAVKAKAMLKLMNQAENV